MAQALPGREFGDSGRLHRYVETVAGQGYRLIAQPQPLGVAGRSQLAAAGVASDQERSVLSRIRDALLSGIREQRLAKLVPLHVTAASSCDHSRPARPCSVPR